MWGYLLGSLITLVLLYFHNNSKAVKENDEANPYAKSYVTVPFALLISAMSWLAVAVLIIGWSVYIIHTYYNKLYRKNWFKKLICKYEGKENDTN